MKYDQDFKQQVLNYHEDGKSIRETARTFRISPQTVINMKHGHYKKNPKKPGVKPSYGNHEVLIIKKWINEQLKLGSLVNARTCKEHVKYPLEIHTIRRIIRSLGYTYDEVEKNYL